MILTGAFLAEAAATVDNKLNVSGGVLSKYTVGPDRVARLVLVVLLRAGGDETNRFIDVDIKPPTLDDSLHERFEAPEASVGEFPGFAFFPFDVFLSVDGRWVIEVTGGEETVSLPLIVDAWAPPPMDI
ncbi:hypothetical protein [Mycobacterium sp. Marseille-P9652]|uniref:hypothetical protein n=1 Tax=Mycobacterium sp. Marseille-P9652 TaxID=2654950 RepID=UPI0012E89FB3|nr:hypothetical protein [Mycobacterium sp. Marseille-P9652]